MLTIGEINKVPNIPQLTLVAGSKGINNTINNVTVYEVYDAYKKMRSNDLIITTFLSVTPNNYAQVFEELSNKKIAGLILCYHELYYKRIPPKMIELADKYNIPFFTAPKDVAYTDIIFPILKKIIGTEYSNLELTVKIMNEYNQLLLNEAVFSDITAFIYHFIAAPILLLDEEFEPITYNANTDKELYTINEFIHEKLPEFKVMCGADIKKGIISSTVCSQISQTCYPIISNNRFLGTLIIFGKHSLEEEKYLIVKQGLSALAILFIHLYADIQSQNSLKKEFLQLVLQDEHNSNSIQEIQEKALQIGLDVSNGLHIVIIKQITDGDQQTAYALLSKHKYVNKCMRKYFSKGLCMTENKHFILFIPYPPDSIFQDSVVNMIDSLNKNLGNIVAGVSSFVSEITEIKNAYVLALQSLEIGHKIYSEDNIFWAKDLEPLIYLEKSIRMEDLAFEKWAMKKLKAVIDYDKEKGIGLFETLKVLLWENGNLQTVADKLYLHKNTLMYRKQLIKRLLGEDPLEKSRFDYMLAFYVLLLKNINNGTKQQL